MYDLLSGLIVANLSLARMSGVEYLISNSGLRSLGPGSIAFMIRSTLPVPTRSVYLRPVKSVFPPYMDSIRLALFLFLVAYLSPE